MKELFHWNLVFKLFFAWNDWQSAVTIGGDFHPSSVCYNYKLNSVTLDGEDQKLPEVGHFNFHHFVQPS